MDELTVAAAMRFGVRMTYNAGRERSETMKAIKYVYWQDEDMWIGDLEGYPDDTFGVANTCSDMV